MKLSHHSGTALSVDPAEKAPREEPAPVPFLDLKAQFQGIRDEVMPVLSQVMESQRFILGPEGRAFEEEIAALLGVEFAVACASGSDALLLPLMALGVGSGDEVIVPAFTFVATAGSVARLGVRPVFVDILPGGFNIDPALVARAITPRTRAIIPVHLFGEPGELDALLPLAQAHRVALVEDAAQAIGARYRNRPVGSFGDFGCFSFYPTKNLGGAGDGGLVVTNSEAAAQKLRLLRDHGAPQKYSYELLGMNSRLDELQAAVLRVKLRHLSEWTAARRDRADYYRQLFKERRLGGLVKLPVAPVRGEHVYNQFTIRARNRDALRGYLTGRGIRTEIYYPSPLHLQPAFQYLGYQPGQFPEAENACREVLSLPIYPELSQQQQTMVVEGIADFYQSERGQSQR